MFVYIKQTKLSTDLFQLLRRHSWESVEPIFYQFDWVGKTFLWVKVLVVKSDNVSSVPTGRKETASYHTLPFDLPTRAMTCSTTPNK